MTEHNFTPATGNTNGKEDAEQKKDKEAALTKLSELLFGLDVADKIEFFLKINAMFPREARAD